MYKSVFVALLLISVFVDLWASVDIHNLNNTIDINIISRECKQLNNGKHEFSPEKLHLAHRATLLSSLAYLQYEKRIVSRSFKEFPTEISFYNEEYNVIRWIAGCCRSLACREKVTLQKAIRKVKAMIQAVACPFRAAANRFNSTQSIDSSNNTAADSTNRWMKHRASILTDDCSRLKHKRERVQLNWYFGDFSEGQWHDTELLVGESDTTLYLSFRGSDSAVDIITNSQRMMSAKYSNIFSDVEGKVHRGFLNAYAKVDSGYLISINNNTKSSNFIVNEMFKMCNTSMSSSSRMAYSTYKQFPKCKIRYPLARILTDMVGLALDTNKKIVITGHSLGGALSVLLVLDMMLNHRQRVWKPTAQHDYQHELEKLSAEKGTVAVDVNKFKMKDTNNNNTGTSNSSLRDFSQLQLVTFGEPDFIDYKFFDHMLQLVPDAYYFFEHHYTRYISLTRAPHCEPDLVTKIVNKFSKLLGDHIVGFSRYGDYFQLENNNNVIETKNKETSPWFFRRKEKTKSAVQSAALVIAKCDDVNESNRPSVKADLEAENNEYSHNDYIKSIAETSMVVKPVHKKRLEKRNNSIVFTGKDGIDAAEGLVNQISVKSGSAQFDSSITRNLRRNRVMLHPIVVDMQYFVCSGLAANTIEAHSMNNYLHGILFSAININNLNRAKHSSSSNPDQVAPNIKRRRKMIILDTDLPITVARKLNLLLHTKYEEKILSNNNMVTDGFRLLAT